MDNKLDYVKVIGGMVVAAALTYVSGVMTDIQVDIAGIQKDVEYMQKDITSIKNISGVATKP